MKKYKYNWLIVFVIHDFDSEVHMSNIDQIINDEIIATGLHDQHAFLLIQKAVTQKGSKEVSTVIKTMRKMPEGSYELFEIGKNEFDFHSEYGWTKLLRWINTSFPSNYICFNILSHGAGFGVLGDRSSRVGAPKESFSFSDVQFGKTAYVRSQLPTGETKEELLEFENSTRNCKAMQMLWFSELADAIKQSFDGRKIDLLLLNNCYVQSFETGWLLYEYVRYLIAPEAWFTSFGYNYRELFKNLNSAVEISPEKLLSNFIVEFLAKWEYSIDLQLIGISVVNLVYYSEMKKYFDNIAFILSNFPDPEIKKIVNARQIRMDNVSNRPSDFHDGSVTVSMVDLLYFYELLLDLFPNHSLLENNIREFIKLFQIALIDQYVGTEYFKSDLNNEKKFKLQGVSVFLPLNSKESRDNEIMNCGYFGRPVVDGLRGNSIPLFRFIQQSQWDEFIIRYLKNDTVL